MVIVSCSMLQCYKESWSCIWVKIYSDITIMLKESRYLKRFLSYSHVILLKMNENSRLSSKFCSQKSNVNFHMIKTDSKAMRNWLNMFDIQPSMNVLNRTKKSYLNSTLQESKMCVTDPALVDIIFSTIIILVHGLQPAHIVVRMRDHVHSHRTFVSRHLLSSQTGGDNIASRTCANIVVF